MTLSRDGPMNDIDVAMLKSRFVLPLPVDKKGRPVLWVDRSKHITEFADGPHDERHIFYILQSLVDNPRSQEMGLELIIDLSNISGASFNRKTARRVAVIFRRCMPVRVHRLHVLCYPVSGRQRVFYERLVPLLLDRIGRTFTENVRVHTAATNDELREMLRHEGFTDNGLPVCVGGKWNAFDEWLKNHGYGLASFAQIQNQNLSHMVESTLAQYVSRSGGKVQPQDPGYSNADGISQDSIGRNPMSTDASHEGQEGLIDIDAYNASKQANLSQVEHEAVNRDIHGMIIEPKWEDNSFEKMDLARMQIDEAIQMIPSAEKEAYTEVLLKAPQLIESECNYEHYMIMEENNCWVSNCSMHVYHIDILDLINMVLV
jgi:hypothetical protein